MSEQSGLRRDLASRNSKHVQIHNKASVGATNWLLGGWIVVEGFNSVALTFENDAFTNSQVNIQWSHDGINVHGMDYAVVTADTNNLKSGETGIKAKYMKIQLYNGDSALHKMSCHAYLKA